MTDKELIKQEIERRYNCENCYPLDREANVAAAVLQELLLFIDSLPEESVSKDLENQYTSNMRYQHAYTQDDLMKTKSEDLEEEIDRYYSDWQFDDDTIYEDMRDICRHFAEWQKQKSMQDLMDKAEKFFKSMYETMGKPNLGDKTIKLFKNYMQDESEN